jgi:hypothetical protein
MTINEALLGDTPDYHKRKRGYYDKKNNCPINEKQEHVLRLVCTFGYSCVLNLSGKIKKNRDIRCLKT